MRHLQAFRRCLRLSNATSCSYSAVPSLVSHEGHVEALEISPNAPLLVNPSERLWGPTAILPPSLIPSGHEAGNIAVLREGFAASEASQRPLSSLVARLGSNSVAVSSDTSSPHQRLLVDQYQRGQDGKYTLVNQATDLYRFLRQEGIRVVHVPDVQAARHAEYNSARSAACGGPRQSTNEVLMVAPTAFDFNEEAAQDNTFMHNEGVNESASKASRLRAQALQEFSGLHRELSEVAGVKVNLFQHNDRHQTPDAVFPNNWFSTHPAGEAAGGTRESTLVFYPMKCPNRARERRMDIQGVLHARGYARTFDLSRAEKDSKYFEGTGALVLDRINGVAYVNLSERADQKIAEHWVQRLGYKDLVTFHATDSKGNAVYHTNVVMAVGTDVAVVCLESVTEEAERRRLKDSLAVHHTVVDISQAQMAALCGNVLELEDGRGLPVLAMSSQAYNAFDSDQRKVLRRHVTELHHAPIDTIERIGGGGVRCSLAEIF